MDARLVREGLPIPTTRRGDRRCRRQRSNGRATLQCDAAVTGTSEVEQVRRPEPHRPLSGGTTAFGQDDRRRLTASKCIPMSNARVHPVQGAAVQLGIDDAAPTRPDVCVIKRRTPKACVGTMCAGSARFPERQGTRSRCNAPHRSGRDRAITRIDDRAFPRPSSDLVAEATIELIDTKSRRSRLKPRTLSWTIWYRPEHLRSTSVEGRFATRSTLPPSVQRRTAAPWEGQAAGIAAQRSNTVGPVAPCRTRERFNFVGPWTFRPSSATAGVTVEDDGVHVLRVVEPSDH